MDCDRALELMPVALDGQMAKSEDADFRAHIAACEDCRSTWEAMLVVSDLLGRAPMAHPSAHFTSVVMKQIEREVALRKELRMVGVLFLSLAYVQALGLLLLGLIVGGAVWLLPAKRLLLTLILQWLWRLGMVTGGLLGVAVDLFWQIAPRTIGASSVLCGMWLIVIALLWKALKSRKLAWVR